MTVHEYYARGGARRKQAMREKVEFPKNQAQELALAYATGREGESDNGAYFLYTTTDDRVFFATPTLNQKIQALKPRPNEALEICLRNNRETGGKNQWDVRRVDPADGRGVEAPAVHVTGISTNECEHPNGSSNGNGHSNGHGPTPAPPTLMTGQSQFCLQQLIAAIDMVHAAEKYAKAMNRPVTFSSEDIRAFAISCYIGQSKGGR